MSHEEYQLQLKSLQITFDESKKDLVKKFCNANNPYKKGDVFKDDIGSIIIESIGYSIQFSGVPCCKYLGLELKKDGKPRKDGSRRWAYQYRDVNYKKVY